jgi:3-methyladenine DNA glycosylase AlkD
MTSDDVMAQLEQAGSAQTRKTYARHGVNGAMFGVSYAILGKLTKAIKVDQALSEKLWATGNHDARILATMIADPSMIGRKQLDAWAAAADNYGLADAIARMVAKTPHARVTAEAWTQSAGEHVGQCGWTVFALLAAAGESFSDADCLALLARIEKTIRTAKNRVRHAMNGSLIAIGGRSTKLRAAAVAAAKRIGPVEVDHGDTSCETPDAVGYIAKIWARKKA